MSKDRNPKGSERRTHSTAGDRRIKQCPLQLPTPPRNISLGETIEIESSDSDVIVLDSLSSSDDDLPSYSFITPPKKKVAGVVPVHGRPHQAHPSPPTPRQSSSSPRRISETPSPRVVSKTKPSSSLASTCVSRSTPLPKKLKLNSGSAVTFSESARSNGVKKSTHSSGSGASVSSRSPSPAPRRRLPQVRPRHRSESSARGRSGSQTRGHRPSLSKTAEHSPLTTHSQRSGFSRQLLKERSGSKGSSCAGRSSCRGKSDPSSVSKDTTTFSSVSGHPHLRRDAGTGRFAHLSNHFSDSDSSDSMSRLDEPGLIPSRSGAIRSPTSRCDLLPSQSGDIRGSTARRDLPDEPGLASSRHGDLTDEPGLVPSRSGVVRSPANSTLSRDLPDEPRPVPSRSGAPSSSTSGRDLPDEPRLPSRSGAPSSSTSGRDLPDEPRPVPSRSGAPSSSTSGRDLPDEPRPVPSRSGAPSSSTSRRDLPDEPRTVPSRSGTPSSSTSRRDLPDEPRPVPSRSGTPSSSTSRRDLPDEPRPVPSRSGAPSSSTSRRDLTDVPRPVPSKSTNSTSRSDLPGLISSGSGTTSSSASRRDLPDRPVQPPSKSGAMRRLFTDEDNSQKTTLNKTRHRSCNLPKSPSSSRELEPDVREAPGSKTAATRRRHATVIDLSRDDCDLTADGDKSLSSKATEGDESLSSKATEGDKSLSSKATEGDESLSCKVAEASTPHSSKILGTGKSYSSKVAETGKARSSKRTETSKSCSGKMTETGSTLCSSRTTEPDVSHSSKTSETGKSHPSKTSETAKSHPSKTSETAKSHPSKTSETAKSHSSKASETAKSHPSKTSETAKSHPSKTSETAKSHPSKTSETAKSHPSKASETGSKSHSSKVAETGKSHSSKPARSGVGNKKTSASRLPKSSSPSSQPPSGIGTGRGPKPPSQSHTQQNTPTGPVESPLKPLLQASSTGKGRSDVLQSRNAHSATFPTIASFPVSTTGGPKSATSTGHSRRLTTTPHPEVPGANQSSSSGSSSVTRIATSQSSSPSSAIVSSKSSGLKKTGPAKNIAASEIRTSLGLSAAETDLFPQASSKKTSMRPLKSSRRIKLKRLTPASQDILTRPVLAAVTKGKGRWKGKQATSHAQDKESASSSGSRAEPSFQSGSSAGCLNIPSRPHSRESVSTCSERIAHDTDDVESLWSFPSMADLNSDSDTMSIISGAGSLDILVTAGAKTVQPTKSSNPKRKHIRRQTARKSTGGFSFKRLRPSYSSGHLVGYGTVPLKSCTVDVIRTKWSRKRVVTGDTDGSSGSFVKQEVKRRKNLQQQGPLKEGGSHTGQISTIKLHLDDSCSTTATKLSHFVDAMIMSECSIPDGIITPKKRKQRKEAKKLPMVLESSDSEPDTDPTPAAKKPKLTPSLPPTTEHRDSLPTSRLTPSLPPTTEHRDSLPTSRLTPSLPPTTEHRDSLPTSRLTPSQPPTTEHRETSSSPELGGETCARTRVNKLPFPRKRISSQSSLTSSKTSSVPPSSLPANSSSSSAKLVLASPLQFGTLWDDSSRQTVKKVPSKSNLGPSTSLTPAVTRTKPCLVMECSPSGAGKSDVRGLGSAPVASSLSDMEAPVASSLSDMETMRSDDDRGVVSQSFRDNEDTIPKIASSKNKLSLRLKPKQDRSSSEPPLSVTPLRTPPPEKSSSVPPQQIQSLSSPVSPAPLKMSPRDEEYSLRLQETIAKLAGGGAEEDGWNFSSPQRPSLLSPPTLATPQADLTVSFRLASLRQQPSPSTPTNDSRSRLPSVTTTRLGTYVSQGVQAEMGMVVNREVLDSYLTVKTNEVLYELKEMLEVADRQVARITKEKEELEKMVMEKERVIQKLTQTGFKYRHKRVDKATSTEKTTKSASTQTKKLRMPKPKKTTNRTPQKSGRSKHMSWKSHATVLPADAPSCLRQHSEEELQPFFNRPFSPPLAPRSPSSGEPDAASPGADAEMSEWLSRENSTSRCIPIRPQVRLIRAVRGGERLRRLSEPTMATRRNGWAVAEWDSIDVNLRGEFLQLWQMLNLFKELRMEPLLLRRLASVIETLDHLLSHVPPPQDQELVLLDGDLQQRTTVGLSAWLLGSKLQQLVLNLEKLRTDDKNHLPSYFRAELIHTRTVVIETLQFLTHGMRHVTMFHDTKGFAIGTNTLVIPTTPSPDLSPSPAPSSLLQCNEEDLDDLFSSSASELESSSSEEEEEEGEERSARTSRFHYKRVPPSPSSCARASPWRGKGSVDTPTSASRSGIGVSPDVSMSIATTEPGLLRLSRAIQQLKVPTSTSSTSPAAQNTSSGISLSTTSTDPTSSRAEKMANPSQNMDRINKVALLEKVAHTITEKINQITAKRLPVPNALNQFRELFPVHPVGGGAPLAPATAARSTPSLRVISTVSSATTGVGKSCTVPSSVVHINARDLLPSSAKESSIPTTAAAAASPATQTTANISGTVCASRVSPQQFTRITDILTHQQSNSTPKPMVVGPSAPLTSHTRPATINPPSSQSSLPLAMKFNFKTLSLPHSANLSGTSSTASTQSLNVLSNQLLPILHSNQILSSNPNMEQLRHFFELTRLSRNHVGLSRNHVGTVGAAVRAVQIPRHPLGPGIDLTAQSPTIAATVAGTRSQPLGPPTPWSQPLGPPTPRSQPLGPPTPLLTSTSQQTTSPCQWTPENVSIAGVATVNTQPRTQAAPGPLVRTDINILNSPPCPVTQVSRLSTGVSLAFGLPTPRLQVVSTSQGIMIKWTFAEEHIHRQRYVDHYDLYAHANSKTHPLPPIPQWGKVGSVSPLPLPMAVTLTNFARGQCYFFAVRALFRGGGKSDYSEPKSVTL